MTAVDLRLLELIGASLNRPLTDMEAHELRESHRYIMHREWRWAKVINQLHLARQTSDWDWMTEIMREYDRVIKLYR